MMWTGDEPRQAGPRRRVLLLLLVLVLAVHVVLLLGAALPVRLSGGPPTSDLTQPLQLRVLNAPSAPAQAEHVAPAAQVVRAQRPAIAAAHLPVPAEPAQVAASEPPPSQQAERFNSPQADDMRVSTPQTLAGVASEPVPSMPSSDLQNAQADAARHAQTLTAHTPVWPPIPVGALPSSRLMHYDLSGMDKGLSYHASGELRWQHNGHAYDLALSVKAFLLGTRVWRSVGSVGPMGLVPRRFSDQWRNERATHFDQEQQRVVFSSRSQVTALEPGAQDQISLYAQLAAAVTSAPARFEPGAQLQVQTATISDAVPWALSLQGPEVLTVAGQSLSTLKWVCQPRNQRGTRVEVWMAQPQAWLPVRIRITQVSGSYIDLHWRSTEPLPNLAESGHHKGADARP